MGESIIYLSTERVAQKDQTDIDRASWFCQVTAQLMLGTERVYLTPVRYGLLLTELD